MANEKIGDFNEDVTRVVIGHDKDKGGPIWRKTTGHEKDMEQVRRNRGRNAPHRVVVTPARVQSLQAFAFANSTIDGVDVRRFLMLDNSDTAGAIQFTIPITTADEVTQGIGKGSLNTVYFFVLAEGLTTAGQPITDQAKNNHWWKFRFSSHASLLGAFELMVRPGITDDTLIPFGDEGFVYTRRFLPASKATAFTSDHIVLLTNSKVVRKICVRNVTSSDGLAFALVAVTYFQYWATEDVVVAIEPFALAESELPKTAVTGDETFLQSNLALRGISIISGPMVSYSDTVDGAEDNSSAIAAQQALNTSHLNRLAADIALLDNVEAEQRKPVPAGQSTIFNGELWQNATDKDFTPPVEPDDYGEAELKAFGFVKKASGNVTPELYWSNVDLEGVTVAADQTAKVGYFQEAGKALRTYRIEAGKWTENKAVDLSLTDKVAAIDTRVKTIENKPAVLASLADVKKTVDGAAEFRPADGTGVYWFDIPPNPNNQVALRFTLKRTDGVSDLVVRETLDTLIKVRDMPEPGRNDLSAADNPNGLAWHYLDVTGNKRFFKLVAPYWQNIYPRWNGNVLTRVGLQCGNPGTNTWTHIAIEYDSPVIHRKTAAELKDPKDTKAGILDGQEFMKAITDLNPKAADVALLLPKAEAANLYQPKGNYQASGSYASQTDVKANTDAIAALAARKQVVDGHVTTITLDGASLPSTTDTPGPTVSGFTNDGSGPVAGATSWFCNGPIGINISQTGLVDDVFEISVGFGAAVPAAEFRFRVADVFQRYSTTGIEAGPLNITEWTDGNWRGATLRVVGPFTGQVITFQNISFIGPVVRRIRKSGYEVEGHQLALAAEVQPVGDYPTRNDMITAINDIPQVVPRLGTGAEIVTGTLTTIRSWGPKGIADGINSIVGVEKSARETADTAIVDRVATLEAKPSLADSTKRSYSFAAYRAGGVIAIGDSSPTWTNIRFSFNDPNYLAANLITSGDVVVPRAGRILVESKWWNAGSGDERASLLHKDSAGTVKATYTNMLATSSRIGQATIILNAAAGDRLNWQGVAANNIYWAENHSELRVSSYEDVGGGFFIPTGSQLLNPRAITGSGTGTGYDGVPVPVRINLPAGEGLLTVTATGGATVSGIDPLSNTCLVTVNGADTALSHTSSVRSTFSGLQRVSAVSTVLALTATATDYDVGTTMLDGDLLEIAHTFNNSVSESQAFWIRVASGSTQRSFPWPDAGNHQTIFEFAATLTSKFKVKQTSASAAPRIIGVKVWRDAANGYVVPTGTESRTVIGVKEGSTRIGTAYIETTSRVLLAVPAGKMVSSITWTPSGNSRCVITDPHTGVIDVSPWTGATEIVITPTYIDIPVGIVKITPASGTAVLSNSTTTTSTTFTVPRTGVWDVDTNIVGWDDVVTPDYSVTLELLDGTTVLDTFIMGGMLSNHLNNNWGYLGQGSNRATLSSGRTYTIRVTSNSTNAAAGVGIQSAIARLATAGNSTTPIGSQVLTGRAITGSVTSVGYDGLSLSYNIPLASGQRLNTVTATGGAVVTIADRIAGTINVAVNGADTVISHTTVAGNTFTGLQRVGRYKPAAPVDIADNVVETGIDMRTAKWLVIALRDNGTSTFDGVTDTRQWQSIWIDLEYARASQNVFYGLVYDNGYIQGRIRNTTTGQMFFNDQVRGMQVVEVGVYDEGANGYVVPTGTTVRTACTITAAGKTWTLFGGTSGRIMVDPGSGNQVSSVSASAGLTVSIADPISGALEVAVEEGTTTGTITPSFQSLSGGAYSTSETTTGQQWIDGKQIYKRTWTGTTPNNANDNALFALPTNAVYLRMEGYVAQSTGPRRVNADQVFSGNSAHGPMFQWYSSDNSIHAFNATGDGRWQNMPYAITIYYTK